MEGRVLKNFQGGTFGSQAVLKHPKESQAGILIETSKYKCPMYVETPKYLFNYHQTGGTKGYYSNPHHFNNITNISKRLNKTTNLNLAKGNQHTKRSQDPLVGDRVPKKSQAGTFGGQAALKYPKDSQAGIPTDPSRQVHLMHVEPPKFHFKYHQIGSTATHNSNPHQFNKNSNNCKGSNKNYSLRPSKVNHSIKK